MTNLRDLIPHKPQGDSALAMCYSRVKTEEHEELERLTQEFLKTKQITVLESGLKPTRTDAFNMFKDKQPEKTNLSTGRQNIYKSLAKGFLYQVVVNHELIGRTNCIDEAVKIRDSHREKIGIRQADY